MKINEKIIIPETMAIKLWPYFSRVSRVSNSCAGHQKQILKELYKGNRGTNDTLDTSTYFLRDKNKEYGYTYGYTYVIKYILYNIFKSVETVINVNTMAINYGHTKRRGDLI